MDASRKRILCVDDSRDTCELYTVVLSDYEVIAAGTVAEAMRIARNNLLDLYLLDALLPDGTGLALCRQIRSFDPNTPVLFVSGAVGQRDQAEAIDAGAQAYLIKPVAVFDLQAAVESLIRQAISRSPEARCTK
jgi:DNA-binding response OmpR family regulator